MIYRQKACGVQELFQEAQDLVRLKERVLQINQMTKYLGDIIGGLVKLYYRYINP